MSIRIHYRRPPDREQVFEQRLVHASAEAMVTLLEHTPLPDPMNIDGRTVLENGSAVVWFTFPGAYHDIGRFHTAGGRFTGYYANILTPVRFLDERTWETTDLFLDVWFDGRRARILDAEELDEAVEHGWVDARTAGTARAEAARLAGEAQAGDWPPAIAREWTLERARRALVAGR